MMLALQLKMFQRLREITEILFITHNAQRSHVRRIVLRGSHGKRVVVDDGASGVVGLTKIVPWWAGPKVAACKITYTT
jgi:hypothetical protein